jgi:hypothetical protein
MKHYEIYNNLKLFCLIGIVSLFTFFSCEDDALIDGAPVDGSFIQMWVNGDIIPVYDYYERITTFGKSFKSPEECQIGNHQPCNEYHMNKIFVIHFQKDLGRITPEKEHYALIFYDKNADDDNDLIDLGVYVNPDTASSKGITLEIVGVSDYTVNAQGIINQLYSNVVSGYAEGTFWNPYRNEFQNGLVVFENLAISTDTTNTFYSEFY